MTREERALQTLIDHQAAWVTGPKPLQQLRVEAMLAFADAEAAAMRERAEIEIIAKADRWLAQQYGLRPLSADLAAIRALPATGEE